MSLELSRVHHFKNVRDDETGTFKTKLVGIHPYVRLCEGSNPPIFVQEGRFYYSGGEEIDAADLPEWFWPAASTISERVRKECKLVFPDFIAASTSVHNEDGSGKRAKR